MMKNLIANSSQINKKKIHKIILDNFADLAQFITDAIGMDEQLF